MAMAAPARVVAAKAAPKAAAPKVNKVQAAKIAKAVGGGAKPKSRRRTPTPATVTRHHGLRQQQRVAAAGAIQQQRVQASSAITQQKSIIKRQQGRRSAITRGTVKTGLAVGEQKSLRSAVGTVVSPAKPAVNPLLLILFTWGAIILLYVLITSPTDTNKFMGSVRSWIGLLYSAKPMFKTTEIVK